jgi:hypothetical protein
MKYSYIVKNIYYKSLTYSPPQRDPSLYCIKYQTKLSHGLSFHCLKSGAFLTVQNNYWQCWIAHDHNFYRQSFVISHSKCILLEIKDYTQAGNTQLHTHTHTHTYTHTYTQTFTYTHIYIYTYTYTHIHIYTHT